MNITGLFMCNSRGVIKDRAVNEATNLIESIVCFLIIDRSAKNSLDSHVIRGKKRREDVVWHLPQRTCFGLNVKCAFRVVLPNDVLAGTASLLIQKDTQERTTIRVHGMYVWMVK